VDPTERFVRTDESLDAIVLPSVDSEGELAVTQPFLKASLGEEDEDLIRTRELPIRGEDWFGASKGGQENPKTMPTGENMGAFSHPALGARLAVSRSAPRSATSKPQAADAQIRAAYAKYVELCHATGKPAVVEDRFTARLAERLEQLSISYPREQIEFSPTLDGETVRVRVLLRRR